MRIKMTDNSETAISQLVERIENLQNNQLKIQGQLKEAVVIIASLKKENDKLKDSYVYSANRLEALENKCLTIRSNEQRITEINNLLRVIVSDPLYAKKQWHAKLDQTKFEIMREL